VQCLTPRPRRTVSRKLTHCSRNSYAPSPQPRRHIFDTAALSFSLTCDQQLCAMCTAQPTSTHYRTEIQSMSVFLRTAHTLHLRIHSAKARSPVANLASRQYMYVIHVPWATQQTRPSHAAAYIPLRHRVCGGAAGAGTHLCV
jgi:hypothetical protein